jgi:hypothetical protein
MSGWAYFAGAGGIYLFGQSGASLLDQALQKEMSIENVMGTAGDLAGLGVSATDAAIIVAGAGLGYKLLQMATPFAETINLWWRRKLLDGPPPGPPPGPVAPGGPPGPPNR